MILDIHITYLELEGSVSPAAADEAVVCGLDGKEYPFPARIHNFILVFGLEALKDLRDLQHLANKEMGRGLEAFESWWDW